MVKGHHVIFFDRIRERLDMRGVFVRLLNSRLTFKAVTLIKLLHQPANKMQATSDFTDSWILFLQAFNTEQLALAQHPICNVKNDIVSILDVLRDLVLNMIVRNRKSLSAFSHIPLRQ